MNKQGCIEILKKFMNDEFGNIKDEDKIDQLFDYCFIKYAYTKKTWKEIKKEYNSLEEYYEKFPENNYFEAIETKDRNW